MQYHMLIGGLQKISLIDYPGKISSVIFTQGCNFRCPFCHNISLVDPEKFETPISQEKIFEFLASRIKQIEGVVISGGEPTIHRDIKSFVGEIKNLGFAIKLDTNGTQPEGVIDLVTSNLIDFIAMDIKHDWHLYNEACGVHPTIKDIMQSADFIMKCGLDYEFRTTVVPGIHSANSVKAIAKNISGAKKFVLQKFVPNNARSESLRVRLEDSFFDKKNQAILEDIENEFLKYVDKFEMRKP